MKPTTIEFDGIKLHEIETKELYAMLAAGIKGAADHLFQVSAIVMELERRGEDLAGLGSSMRKYLRLVASGALLPEILVSYQGRECILAHLAEMPVADQRRVLEDPTVTILIDERPKRMKLLAIPYGAVDQLFDGGRIRSEDEQVIYIRTKGKRERKAPRQLKARPDFKRGGILIGNGFASKADVILALSELSGKLPDLDPTTCESGGFNLTTEEKQRLRALEAQSGLSEWQIVRQALHATGVI